MARRWCVSELNVLKELLHNDNFCDPVLFKDVTFGEVCGKYYLDNPHGFNWEEIRKIDKDPFWYMKFVCYDDKFSKECPLIVVMHKKGFTNLPDGDWTPITNTFSIGWDEPPVKLLELVRQCIRMGAVCAIDFIDLIEIRKMSSLEFKAFKDSGKFDFTLINKKRITTRKAYCDVKIEFD